MKLEKVWALIGLYWVLFTMSYPFLPYEIALTLVTVGYYSCFPLLAGTLVLAVYRRFRGNVGLWWQISKWWKGWEPAEWRSSSK